MHAPTRHPSKLFVTPRMALHPTLAGEQVEGVAPPLPRVRHPPRSGVARRPERTKQPMSAGEWLFVCAAPAIAAVIFAGLLA